MSSRRRSERLAERNPDDMPSSIPPKLSKCTESSEKTIFNLLAPIFLCFVISCGILFLVYSNFPPLTVAEWEHIRLPKSIEQAKSLGRILSKYSVNHYYQVLASVLVVYIFLQSFAIPGSIFLSILSGFLFGRIVALLLICFCSATGASICYFISSIIGKPFAEKYIPNKLSQFRTTIAKEKEQLLWYMIFLRVTPILPNWLINICAPLVSLPLSTFYLGTFIGVIPPSALAVQTGQTLEQMTNESSTFSWHSALVILVAALISLIPVFYKKLQYKAKVYD